MSINRAWFGVLAAGAAAALLLAAGCKLPEDTEEPFPGGLPIERVSMSATGTEGDGYSTNPSISADGR